MASLPVRKSKHQAFAHRETRGRIDAQRGIIYAEGRFLDEAKQRSDKMSRGSRYR